MNLFKASRLGTLGLLLLGAGAGAVDLEIESIQVQPGRVEVRYNNEPGFYYILWRGEQLSEIRFAADLGRGTFFLPFLADTNATNAALFYRVEKVLMAAQRDTDGDGICDAWELLYRQPGAALSPGDASEDHNGNGISDLTEARRESFREGAVRGRPVLAAGLYHSLAIRQNGTLWGWGDNLFGQLGSSSFTDTNAPAQIGTDTNWLAVSCALFTSYGLKTDGTLWYWGQCNTGNVFQMPLHRSTIVRRCNPTAAAGNLWTVSPTPNCCIRAAGRQCRMIPASGIGRLIATAACPAGASRISRRSGAQCRLATGACLDCARMERFGSKAALLPLQRGEAIPKTSFNSAPTPGPQFRLAAITRSGFRVMAHSGGGARTRALPHRETD